MVCIRFLCWLPCVAASPRFPLVGLHPHGFSSFRSPPLSRLSLDSLCSVFCVLFCYHHVRWSSFCAVGRTTYTTTLQFSRPGPLAVFRRFCYSKYYKLGDVRCHCTSQHHSQSVPALHPDSSKPVLPPPPPPPLTVVFVHLSLARAHAILIWCCRRQQVWR